MKQVYLCPKCRSELNPGEKIILKAFSGPLKGLLLFSPRLGDYTVNYPGNFPIEEGEEIDFCCPVCSFELTSGSSERFAELAYRRGAEEGIVMFSKIAGEHATFLVMPRQTETFGEHAEGYSTMNFFGEGAARE